MRGIALALGFVVAAAGLPARPAALVDPEASVRLEVRAEARGEAISPWIYGTNMSGWDRKPRGVTWVRLGGNRWSAYNWRTNASHAGTDWHNQNDGYLGGGDRPGEAVRGRLAELFEAGLGAMVTVPMLDRVAADKQKGGDVASGPGWRERRFLPNRPRRDGRADGIAQEEFVAWLEGQFPGRHGSGPRLFYSLDNEPALWPTTHPRPHPEQTTYAEVLEKSVAYAAMIKGHAPEALVFGPASYGWRGMTDLQDAPDARGRDFLATYLETMRRAEERHGRRLLDVLDVHWYPEVRVGKVRVSRPDADAKVAAARVQSTRSLWDPGYEEDSWIGRLGTGPIRLVPRLRELVASRYPGTRLAITEYSFGGGGDPSGAVAQADALGIFGREGLFAAAVYTNSRDPDAWIYAAFRMYRDLGGQAFGDLSVPAQSSDPERVTIYASRDSENKDLVPVVVVNKSDKAEPVSLRVHHADGLRKARIWRLAGARPRPRFEGSIQAGAVGVFGDVLPPMSVTTYFLEP